MRTGIENWEDQVGVAVAERLWSEARERLRSGDWGVADLEAAVVDAQRRLTARQSEQLWDALSWDIELAQLAAGIEI